MKQLDWLSVDKAAKELGVSEFARKKWRQANRGIPSKWWLPISRKIGAPVEALEAFNNRGNAA